MPAKSKPKKKRARPRGPTTFHIDKRSAGLIPTAPASGKMLTTMEMAAWLGVSHQWLECARMRGDGPPYERIAPRLIRYDVGKVVAWLAQRAAAAVR